MTDNPYWTSRKNSFEFIELSNINDVSLVKLPSFRSNAVIKPISECVRIACSGLTITSLLQVVNRLDAS